MDKFDPTCSCGKKMSEHKDGGAAFALIYDQILTMMVQDVRIPADVSELLLKNSLTALVQGRTPKVQFYNSDNGSSIYIVRDKRGGLGITLEKMTPSSGTSAKEDALAGLRPKTSVDKAAYN